MGDPRRRRGRGSHHTRRRWGYHCFVSNKQRQPGPRRQRGLVFLFPPIGNSYLIQSLLAPLGRSSFILLFVSVLLVGQALAYHYVDDRGRTWEISELDRNDDGTYTVTLNTGNVVLNVEAGSIGDGALRRFENDARARRRMHRAPGRGRAHAEVLGRRRRALSPDQDGDSDADLGKIFVAL